MRAGWMALWWMAMRATACAADGPPEAWAREGVETVASYVATGHLASSGGVRLSVGDGLIRLAVEGEGGLVRMPDEAAYSSTGVVCLRVVEASGVAMSVKMLCWRRDGAFIRAVSLLTDIAAAGDHTMPFVMHQDMIPEDTARVSFQLQASGAGGKAVIAGLFLGRHAAPAAAKP